MSNIAPIRSSVDLYSINEVSMTAGSKESTVHIYQKSYHVDAKDGHPGSIVIFVKDPGKFMINECRTLFEAPSPPGIKRATLKLVRNSWVRKVDRILRDGLHIDSSHLDNRVWSQGTLLDVTGVEIRWQTFWRPNSWLALVEVSLPLSY